jgi:hypothetical protein
MSLIVFLARASLKGVGRTQDAYELIRWYALAEDRSPFGLRRRSPSRSPEWFQAFARFWGQLGPADAFVSDLPASYLG